MIEAGFTLTRVIEIFSSVRVENTASRRVLEKCGFEHLGEAMQGAPARGIMVNSAQFRLTRAAWTAQRALYAGLIAAQFETERASP